MLIVISVTGARTSQTRTMGLNFWTENQSSSLEKRLNAVRRGPSARTWNWVKSLTMPHAIPTASPATIYAVLWAPVFNQVGNQYKNLQNWQIADKKMVTASQVWPVSLRTRHAKNDCTVELIITIWDSNSHAISGLFISRLIKIGAPSRGL